MDAYSKHPLEDLTDAQLDEILASAEMPFTAQNLERITTRFEEEKQLVPTKKRTPVRWLIPLIALLALALVGFTKYDVIAQLIMDAFGTRDVGQYAQPLNGDSIDQGIQMELLSGLHDGDSTYLFVSLTNTDGSHNLDGIIIDSQSWDLSGYGDLYGANCRMIRYEPSTNTAYLLVHGIGGTPGKSATFSLRSFGGGKVTYDFIVPEVSLSGILAHHEATFLDFGYYGQGGLGIGDAAVPMEVILAKDELDVALPGTDRATLTNIAYRNGALHIQLKHSSNTPNERITPTLVEANTGVVVEASYSTNYDGTVGYTEHVFAIPDVTDLENYSLRLEGWYFADSIEGNWTMQLVVPQQMERITLDLEQSIPTVDGEIYVNSLSLSPLYIHVDASLPKGESLDITVHYADGTSMQMEVMDDYWLPYGAIEDPNNHERNTITFVHPITDFENIQAIEINGLHIDIDEEQK